MTLKVLEAGGQSYHLNLARQQEGLEHEVELELGVEQLRGQLEEVAHERSDTGEEEDENQLRRHRLPDQVSLSFVLVGGEEEHANPSS